MNLRFIRMRFIRNLGLFIFVFALIFSGQAFALGGAGPSVVGLGQLEYNLFVATGISATGSGPDVNMIATAIPLPLEYNFTVTTSSMMAAPVWRIENMMTVCYATNFADYQEVPLDRLLSYISMRTQVPGDHKTAVCHLKLPPLTDATIDNQYYYIIVTNVDAADQETQSAPTNFCNVEERITEANGETAYPLKFPNTSSFNSN